jgi:hypothetical protein
MSGKTGKKQKRSDQRIVVEAVSNDLPLTAFLSMFSGQEKSAMMMETETVRYGAVRRTFRKCS